MAGSEMVDCSEAFTARKDLSHFCDVYDGEKFLI